MDRTDLNLQFSPTGWYRSFHLNIVRHAVSPFRRPFGRLLLLLLLSFVFPRNSICFATCRSRSITHANILWIQWSNVGEFGNRITKHTSKSLWLRHADSRVPYKEWKKKVGSQQLAVVAVMGGKNFNAYKNLQKRCFHLFKTKCVWLRRV